MTFGLFSSVDKSLFKSIRSRSKATKKRAEAAKKSTVPSTEPPPITISIVDSTPPVPSADTLTSPSFSTISDGALTVPSVDMLLPPPSIATMVDGTPPMNDDGTGEQCNRPQSVQVARVVKVSRATRFQLDAANRRGCQHDDSDDSLARFSTAASSECPSQEIVDRDTSSPAPSLVSGRSSAYDPDGSTDTESLWAPSWKLITPKPSLQSLVNAMTGGGKVDQSTTGHGKKHANKRVLTKKEKREIVIFKMAADMEFPNTSF